MRERKMTSKKPFKEEQAPIFTQNKTSGRLRQEKGWHARLTCFNSPML